MASSLWETLDQQPSAAGELALQRRKRHLSERWEYRICLDDVAVLSTRLGESDAALANRCLALSMCEDCRVLLGGLGLGETLAKTLQFPKVRELIVVEPIPVLVSWHRMGLIEDTAPYIADSRLRILHHSLGLFVRESDCRNRFDVIMLQGSLLSPAAQGLSVETSLDATTLESVAASLAAEGLFATWLNSASEEAFIDELARHFARVGTEQVEFYHPQEQQWLTNTLVLARKSDYRLHKLGC